MTQFQRPLYGEYAKASSIALADPLPQGVYAGMTPSIAGPGGVSGWTASLSPDADGFSQWRTRGTPSAGRYVIQETAAVTVAIAAPDAVNPRIDLIVGIHKWVAGPVDPGTLEPTGEFIPAQQATYAVVRGTPAVTPAEPAVPDPWEAGGSRAVVLAKVTVPITGLPTITRYAATDMTELPGALHKTGDQAHSGGYFRVAQAPVAPTDVARLSDLSGVSALAVPTGSLLPYAGAAAPTGFLLCDGSLISRTTYAALFTAIGVVFGVGDGSTTFGLPDLRGRTPIGAGAGTLLTNRPLAIMGGEEAHLLTTAEMPSHTHNGVAPYLGVIANYNDGAGVQMAVGNGTQISGATGGGGAHNNMQPFIALNYIIKS